MKPGLLTHITLLFLGATLLLSACGGSTDVNPNYNWKRTAGNLSASEVTGQDKDITVEKFPL